MALKHRGGSKTNVMLALLAVLLVSLGYLSTQKEGMGAIGPKHKKHAAVPVMGPMQPTA